LVRVTPSNVTLETNQLIQFGAQAHNDAGESVSAPVAWKTSGGTILPDGRFSAATIGTFSVVAVSRVHGQTLEDTSFVRVVRRQTNLSTVKVTPASVTLTPGLSQTFSAVGKLHGGKSVPIGVTWSASGGSIDAGGTYVAGDTAGTYQVVATNTAATLSDTALVTISAPPSAPPPAPEPPTTPVPDTTPAPAPAPAPAPEPAPAPAPAPAPEPAPAPAPPPAPVVEELKLMPASATLAPSATRQFAAYGRTGTGDSVSVPVTFSAAGGSISSSGLFTAGSAYGTFRVIAKSGTLADTSIVTISVPLGSGAPTGLPFGPSQQLSRTLQIHQPFTMTADGGYNPTNMINRINAARAGGYKLLLQIPSGSHTNNGSPLMSIIDGVYQFDEAKWRAAVDQFNTPVIRQAIADAVRDGVIIGDVVMDEPQVSGSGDGNTWGPKGTMTKARVDGLCSYIKQIFPTLPAGPFHQHNTFEPNNSYYVCDFIVDQYNQRRGDITTFRDDGLALARRDGHAVMFSLNILDGGVQDTDGTWDCTGTGGLGTHQPNCRMTADQVREWGKILGPAGCGLFMWRWDDSFIANPDNQQAFKEIAALMAAQPYKECRR
jgi:hypothetical protein